MMSTVHEAAGLAHQVLIKMAEQQGHYFVHGVYNSRCCFLAVLSVFGGRLHGLGSCICIIVARGVCWETKRDVFGLKVESNI